MQLNTETTRLGKARMAIGTILAAFGVLALAGAGLLGFTNLPLTFAAILLIFSGILIAASLRLAELITDFLR